jgi:hypothetical protein
MVEHPALGALPVTLHAISCHFLIADIREGPACEDTAPLGRELGKSPRVPHAWPCAHLKCRARSGEEEGRPLPAGFIPLCRQRLANTVHIKDFEP